MFRSRVYTYAFLLFFCSCCISLQGNITELSFRDLETSSKAIDQTQDREVHIRGFLYQTESGDYVLSAHPNLKTCCVGTQKNVNRQLFISGNFEHPLPQNAAHIKGVFRIAPERDETGTLRRLYHIENGSLIEKRGSSKLFYGMTTLALLCSVLYVRKVRSRAHQKHS